MAIEVDTVRPSTRFVAHLTRIPLLRQYHFWIALICYALLLAGTLYRQL
jgi:hypothetical protein